MALTQYTNNVVHATAANDAISKEMFVWKVQWNGSGRTTGDSIIITDNATTPNVLVQDTLVATPTAPLVYIINKHSLTGFKVGTLGHGTVDIFCDQDSYVTTTKVPVAVDYT